MMKARTQHIASSQTILAVAALFSGAALVASIVTGISLALTLASLAAVALLTVAYEWAVAGSDNRVLIRKQLVIGALAGVVATAAYDLMRLSLTRSGLLTINPFETFGIFGKLILGSGTSESLALAVGASYHLLNGVAFAVAYCFLLGGRNWKYGILWATGLEAAMLTVYPGWLDLEAVMKEFVTVSVLGHLAYGTALGIISQRWLAQDRSNPTLQAEDDPRSAVGSNDTEEEKK